MCVCVCVCVCEAEEGLVGGEERWGHLYWALCGRITGWDVCSVASMTASLASLSDSPRGQNTQMGGGCVPFFFFFFFLSFSSFPYELRGAVYQSWKMPQRGPDQRQALNCVLRWIALPNTLMRWKHKFHKQLFSICLAIVLAMLFTINGVFFFFFF